jgi:hypothetical protein
MLKGQAAYFMAALVLRVLFTSFAAKRQYGGGVRLPARTRLEKAQRFNQAFSAQALLTTQQCQKRTQAASACMAFAGANGAKSAFFSGGSRGQPLDG